MQKIGNRSLLPLNALRAFECAARHLSFTKAAEELNVTQGAVSRQIKSLEQQLQVTLFRRLHRRIILTDQGHLLLPSIVKAMDMISEAIDGVQTQSKDINIKVHPSFAIRWLIPRLKKFKALHPEIEIRFTTSNTNVNFKRENFDMGITFGGEGFPGVRRQELLAERLTPVFSPHLLNNPHPIKTVEDLRHHLLLHNTPDQSEWRAWAAQVGVDGLPFKRGPVFEIDDAALQAATAGIGVALGDLFLVKDDLTYGRLMAPFAHIKVDTYKYYLSWPDFNDGNPHLVAFRHWLTEEIKQTIQEVKHQIEVRA